MLNVFIIVWRESLEALLLLGILQAWIGTRADAQGLRRGLWAGVAAGVVLAAGFGAAAFAAQQLFDGIGPDLYQCAMALGAAVLIVQMLWWMRRHGAAMRQTLHARANASASAGAGTWGLAAVAALAVAREGSETALFLLGTGGGATAAERAGMLAAAATGLAAAVATSVLLARGSRRLSPRTVFRAAEALLLLVAAAMLAHALDRLAAIDWLPLAADALWDGSAWLPDDHGLGRVLADLAGYRARPSANWLGAMLLFWGGSLAALRSARPAAAGAAPASAPGVAR